MIEIVDVYESILAGLNIAKLELDPILGFLKDILKDEAMLRPEGGVDFKTDKMNVETNMDSRFRGNDREGSGDGIQFHLDPAMLEQLKNSAGFVPTVISMEPVKDLYSFLGISH